MNAELKRRLVGNSFVYELRLRKHVDRDSYDRLCVDLALLANEWRGEKLIDKELMQYLYVVPTIVKGTADALEKEKDDRAWDIQQMAIILDSLVSECLYDETCVPELNPRHG